MTTTSSTDHLLAAAQGGDETAFADLVGPFRGELHAHCYRMLASMHDAEDAFQDAQLRAWRSLGRFEGRSSLRSWLYTICTNTCLDVINKRDKRVLPIDYGPKTDPHDGPGEPLIETVWVEPYPDAEMDAGYASPESRFERRESVELAFIAALQYLPANQRATLILREVLGFSAAEVAEQMETSVASVNSALQRARKTIDDKTPDESQQAALRALGDAALSSLVEDYIEALDANDVDRVVTMLTEDAAWSMPPLASYFQGIEDVRLFLASSPLSGRFNWKRVGRLRERPAGRRRVHVARRGERVPAVRAGRADAASRREDRRGDGVHRARLRGCDKAVIERWPDLPVDQARAADIFERFGLPPRLEA